MSRRHIVAPLALAAAWVGCSLAIDTSDLASGSGSDAGPIGDASLDGSPKEGDASPADVPDASIADAAPCNIDVTSDPKNCGRCGRDCLGGTCVNAQCTPIAVIRGESPILGIALDTTHIYWSRFDGWVRSAKLDGTGVGDIRKLDAVGHIEVDDTYIYAPGRATGAVRRFRKDASGVVEPLAQCVGECLGIAVKDGRVYFTQRAPGGVGELLIVEADGGATSLLSGLIYPEDMFATPTRLLIANEGADSVLALVYGATTSSVVTAVTDPVAVVEDATDLFMVSQNTKTIRRRPITGGAVLTIADTPSTPVGIAQTATAIYWANDDGTILRLAK